MHAASPCHQHAQIVQPTVQWGGRTPKDGGRELDRSTCSQMPSLDAAAV